MQPNNLNALAVALAIALTTCCLSNIAAAQEDQGEDKSRDVIRFGVVVVHGRAYKPNAFFVNTRSALVYQDLELRESFVSQITEPLEDKDF